MNSYALRLEVLKVLKFDIETALHNLVASPTRLLVDVIVVSESHAM